MILLCSISCSDLNGSFDGDDDSFGFNDMLYLSIKIRFEAPKRQPGREGDIKDTEVNL
jgi:hypothetical protein